MPTEVRWETLEPPTIYYRISDPWSWEEFYQVMKVGRALRLKQNVPCTDLIIDVSQLHRPPHNVLTHFGNILRYESPSTDQIRWIVMVGAMGFIRSATQILVRLKIPAAQKVHFTDSVPEAQALFRSLPERVD